MQLNIHINPAIITWAIARAGYELDEFVTQKYPNAKAWLNNEKKPTIRQLEEFSNKVHIPFGYLFLDEPPAEQAPIPFFRTGRSTTYLVSLNIYDTILLLQRRQEWMNEYLTNSGELPLSFVGKFNLNTPSAKIAADMRQMLGLSENWARQFPTWEKAKNYLIEQIENIGVVVNLNGVVGNNNKRSIPVEECRGFVLVDRMAPFLFINNNDSKSAQMFTLAHELAHVWLGKSAGFDLKQMSPADEPIEQLCDQVAAEFLVPAGYFLEAWAKQQDIRLLARNFKVSPIVIARRALTLQLIQKPQFFSFYNNYTQEKNYLNRKKSEGGDYYATQKSRLGLRFTALVNQAVKEGKLLYSDAYRLTGLQGNTYQQFIQRQNL
jgi:Zn-dependent peptidase ImmA (M78 family)